MCMKYFLNVLVSAFFVDCLILGKLYLSLQLNLIFLFTTIRSLEFTKIIQVEFWGDGVGVRFFCLDLDIEYFLITEEVKCFTNLNK